MNVFSIIFDIRDDFQVFGEDIHVTYTDLIPFKHSEFIKINDIDINKSLGKYTRVSDGDKYCESDCDICLGNFKVKEGVRKLKCGHFFHKKCIDKWIKLNPSCPLCRDVVIIGKK